MAKMAFILFFITTLVFFTLTFATRISVIGRHRIQPRPDFIDVPHDNLHIPTRDLWYEMFTDIPEAPRIFDIEELRRNGCPDVIFYLDCNVCECAEIGEQPYMCTQRPCGPPPKQLLVWEHGLPCPAGELFYHKCNNCTCFEDGRTASCTNWPCPNLRQRRQ